VSKRLPVVVWLICVLAALTTLHASSASAKLPTLRAGGAMGIDRVLQAAVEEGGIPGIVAAITNREQVLYLEAFGKQDVTHNVPMSRGTIFRIASMTKPITSVAVMMLCERGKLRLDDAAAGYLPSLKGREVIASFNEKDGTYTTRPAKQRLTIRHLLTHTSGLAYSSYSPILFGIEKKT